MSAAVATVLELRPEPTRSAASVSYDTDRPTDAQYRAFQQMFAYFGEQLFDGALPQPILTFSRRARSAGFFAPDRWSARDDDAKGVVSEIAVNPDHLRTRTPIEIASTLVHEMAHLWQHLFGEKRSRRAYHNMEWSQKMESVGLMPSSTGEPGGKRVGQHMTHYVIVGGPFAEAFAMMPAEWFFPFLSGAPERKSGSGGGDPSKSKFQCPGCGDSARGKPSLMIGCRKCGVAMVLDGAPNPEANPV